MDIKTKFKPGDIVWVKGQTPFKFLICMVIIDEQGIPLYCGGRNPKEDQVYPEVVLSDTKPAPAIALAGK
jgi:hypothetical protein